MADTDTDDTPAPEKTNINIRLTESFLHDIDATWEREGFNSRSEFIRYVLRDAIKHPEFTRETWKEIASEEYKLRTGEGEGVPSEDVTTDVEQDD